MTSALCEPRRASIELFSALDRLLSDRGWTFADVNGLALTLGPGSFTGVRVGVSTVKGLCSARAVPIAGIGTLDAVALASGCVGHVAACLDAKQGEIYARLFHCDGVGAPQPRSEEVLLSPAAWADVLKAHESLWIVGDGAVAYRDALVAAFGSRARFAPPAAAPATAVARLGAWSLAAGGAVPARELFPRYVRRAAAEVNWERGLVGTRRRVMLGQEPAARG